MGNAHVAVVDDKEAIYYNYAGLNQLGKLGDYKNHLSKAIIPATIWTCASTLVEPVHSMSSGCL
jgi:hypothetical protein